VIGKTALFQNNLFLGIIWLKQNVNLEKNPDQFIEEILSSPLASLVYIEKQNMAQRTLEVLFPTSEPGEMLFELYWVNSDISWIKTI
jgi:hypothetical protein